MTQQQISSTLAERIAQQMRRAGFECEAAQVKQAVADGGLPGNEALAAAILQELGELGLRNGPTE